VCVLDLLDRKKRRWEGPTPNANGECKEDVRIIRAFPPFRFVVASSFNGKLFVRNPEEDNFPRLSTPCARAGVLKWRWHSARLFFFATATTAHPVVIVTFYRSLLAPSVLQIEIAMTRHATSHATPVVVDKLQISPRSPSFDCHSTLLAQISDGTWSREYAMIVG